MWMVAVVLIALAAGDPRLQVATPAQATAVICIDASGSMLSTDVAPNRAAAAKAAATDFIDAAAAGTRVGLIAFAEKAAVIQFPTADRNLLASALNALPKPDGGTALGDALKAAARILPDAGRRSVVLITDGENNRGEAPEAAARTLAAMHVSVETVAVGASPLAQRALRRYAGGGAYLSVAGASNLRAALSRLGRTASTEERPVDLTALLAISGGALLALATLAGCAAGRYP